jgi:acylphosphatase
MTAGEKAFRWIISGQVQGVGFRWYTAREARSLDLAGWVSNLRDGSVEVVARGTPDQLATLEEMIRKGPQGAHVDGVEKSAIPLDGVIDKGFGIK